MNTDMRKFESSQKDESRAQSTDSSKAGVGKCFLRRNTLKILLLPRAACSYYIYYIYNRFETLKKFYMSYHKMKVTIVTSGWVEMRFRMKRVEKTILILTILI